MIKDDCNNTFARNVSWSIANIIKLQGIDPEYFQEAVQALVKVLRQTAFHDCLVDCVWGLTNFCKDGSEVKI